jgi:exonuclease VII large subunit
MVDVVCKDNPKCSIRLGREEKRLSGGAALQYAVQGEALPTALIVKLSPGELMEKESHEVASFEVFLKSPQGWAKRIDDEIKLSTSYQQAMDQFQSELKSKLDENIKDETAQFTEQEKEEIYKMLGELRDRCAALEESKQITPKEFREIETTCQDLAQAANRMPKKVWLRTISSRFYIYSKKLLLSKPGQLAIGEGLKQLIDELPKWMS